MYLTINHQSKTFEIAPNSLAELLAIELPQARKGIAVALNNQVIPEGQWPHTPLSNHDSILIITATQGG